MPWPPELHAAREEALRKLRSGEISKFGFPQHLIQQKYRDRGWERPVPLRHIVHAQNPCKMSFRSHLPPQALGDIHEESLDSIIDRTISDRLPRYTSFLGEDWRFDEVEKDSWARVGHQFEGRRHTSVAEIVLGGVYDLEASLLHFHPMASCESVRDFFCSWQVWKHIAEFSRNVGKSKTASALAGDDWWKAGREASNARSFLYAQVTVFAHVIGTIAPQTAVNSGINRDTLKDRYFATFPEKIKILDVCWAAGERYREWKRWLQKPSPIKDGTKPDRAFRAFLTSGKRPIEYRTVERPPKWE